MPDIDRTYFPRPSPVTPRSAPKPEPNPLTDAPGICLWSDLEAYFKDTKERVLLQLSEAEELKDLWRTQGKLALLEEFDSLRDIMFTLNTLGKG